MIRTFTLLLLFCILCWNAIVCDVAPANDNPAIDALVESMVKYMNDPSATNKLDVDNRIAAAPIGRPAVALPPNAVLETTENTPATTTTEEVQPAQAPPVEAPVPPPPPRPPIVLPPPPPPIVPLPPPPPPPVAPPPPPPVAPPPPPPPIAPVAAVNENAATNNVGQEALTPVTTVPVPTSTSPPVLSSEPPIPSITAAPTGTATNSFSMITTMTTTSMSRSSMTPTSSMSMSRSASPTSTQTFTSGARLSFKAEVYGPMAVVVVSLINCLV